MLPSAAEINHQSIDGPYAEKHFLGKTLADAQQLFEDDSLTYLEDLAHMPSAGFAYYFPAAIAYFQSPAATGDGNAVSSFLGSLHLRLGQDAEGIATSFPSLLDALEGLRDDWDRFFLPDDPDVVSWKSCQKTAAWQAKTTAELLALIERLQQSLPRRRIKRSR